MYNEEQKWSFIHSYGSGEGVAIACRVLFDAIEPLEEELGLDVCQIKDADRIRNYLSGKTGMRSRSIAVRLSTLRAYCRWCLDKGIEGATPVLLDIKIGASDKLSTTMVGDPVQLQEFLDAVFENESALTYDLVLRCYCWLGFMGVRKESLEGIRSEDVDVKNLKVMVDGKEYGMYRSSNDADFVFNSFDSSTCFEKCKSLTSFKYYHPLYNDIIWRERVGGNQLLRGIKSEARIERLRETLSKANREATREGRTRLRLTYERMWLSGLFYRMYLQELQGEAIDFKSVGELTLEDDGDRESDAYKSRIAHTVAGIKKDYNSWKEIYGY